MHLWTARTILDGQTGSPHNKWNPQRQPKTHDCLPTQPKQKDVQVQRRSYLSTCPGTQGSWGGWHAGIRGAAGLAAAHHRPWPDGSSKRWVTQHSGISWYPQTIPDVAPRSPSKSHTNFSCAQTYIRNLEGKKFWKKKNIILAKVNWPSTMPLEFVPCQNAICVPFILIKLPNKGKKKVTILPNMNQLPFRQMKTY